MADQRKPDESKDCKPVPSSSMYIGLCQTRAQAAVLRWQYAIVFMALNGVIGGWCFQLLRPDDMIRILGITLIALIMFFANLLFRGLVNRANQWIDYFTLAIEAVENKCGTETGIRVFSDPNYLSKDVTQPLVRGFRFRQGIRTLCDGMLLIWGGVFLATLAWGSYVAGHTVPIN
jgi:hypothetical protein